MSRQRRDHRVADTLAAASARTAPPKLAMFAALYQTDALFGSLVNLVVISCLTLAFKFAGFLDFQLPALPGAGAHTSTVAANPAVASGAASTPASRAASNPQSASAAAEANRPLMPGPGAPGDYTVRTATGWLVISSAVITAASQDIATALTQANVLLKRFQADRAAEVLAPFDPSNPAIAYAQAVIAHHRRRPDDMIAAMRRLRLATAVGLPQAFTLNGRLLLIMIAMHELGRLPADELQILDSLGETVPATKQQLAEHAVQWWERGAAMGDLSAVRYLGFAHATGFGTAMNLTTGITYWRDAATRGDIYSKAELGLLSMRGAGVKADVDQAIRYLRDAVDGGFTQANLPLGGALLARVLKGDEKAVEEGRVALKSVITAPSSLRETTRALDLLGLYYMDAATVAHRDPKRAVALFHAAVWLGYLPSTRWLARAYATGVGASVDPQRAAYYDGLHTFAKTKRGDREALAALEHDPDFRTNSLIPKWAQDELRDMQLAAPLLRIARQHGKR